MNETNPFADRPTNGPGPSKTSLWWVIILIAALLAGVSWWHWSSSKTNRKSVEALRSELDKSTNGLVEVHAQNQKYQDQIKSLQAQLSDLEKERELVKEKARSLEDEMRADLESRDVTISKLQGKLTVNILDRIMFDSGEAILKPGGEEVMQKIATFLGEHPELKIHVIGHTDNVPIRPGAHSRFASNWELSMTRALAALHFLTDKAGVDPSRTGAVGYGEYRPIADNSTAEGRAKNRRIAIAILPDEINAADAAVAEPEVSTK